MLVKRSSKNQISIPKAVLERAGMGTDDIYFEVEYEGGRIVLIPVRMEEKIPREALERFESKVLLTEPGDKEYGSVGEAVKDLRKARRS